MPITTKTRFNTRLARATDIAARTTLVWSLLTHAAIASSDDTDSKDKQPPNAQVLHPRREPSVTFGSKADIQHDMIAGSVTLNIAGTAMDSADFVAEKGQQFTVSDGKGIERWELRGRVTQQSDGA